MTIDPTKQYRLRNGCEVVRIIPTPECSSPIDKLAVIFRKRSGDVVMVQMGENGRPGYGQYDTVYDLIPLPEESQ